MMGRICIMNFFKLASACVLLFAQVWLCADAPKASPHFGERYINFRYNFRDEPNSKQTHGRDPIAAGTWEVRAHKTRPLYIIVDGNAGSQLYLKMKLNDALSEAIVYSPKGRYAFEHPAVSGRGDERGEFKERGIFTAFAPTYDELAAYRNMALNPLDFQDLFNDSPSFFPHASASSECRNDPIFRARNAIDGFGDNLSHVGWKHRSWGPEKENNQDITIDFGRPVELDKIVVRLRADFPHDSVWTSGVLEFSDGTSINISFKKTADDQTFKFPKRKTNFIKLSKLTAPIPVGWCAISELEAWGRDIMPFHAYDKNGKLLAFADALATLEFEKLNATKNLWLWRMLFEKYPTEADWLRRDMGMDFAKLPKNAAERIDFFTNLALKNADGLKDKSAATKIKSAGEKSKNLKDAVRVYAASCKAKRVEFFSQLKGKPNRYIYVERYPIAPSFYGYTEGASDARGEMKYAPNSALCMLTILPDGNTQRTVLLEDKTGTIRDPDVSYDGKRVLFSWKKSALEDDFHLYEMDLATKKIRQITEGKAADIEGKYLPTGEIVFNSTRCEQTTDCWITEVSNLYMMRPDGSFMRRIGYDQVCTTYPTVTEQGDVLYTRWDYNDRGQTFTQPLFLMRADGTFQTEFYGNKSWYPTAIGHARQIPGSHKVLAILHGHHTAQRGKLAEIDIKKGRQENAGVELLAPRRKEEPVRVDTYGQKGDQFTYPFPLSEDLFLVSFDCSPTENRSYPMPYGLYLMNPDGDRELLAFNTELDCTQAVALAPRDIPSLPKSTVDYSNDKGYLFIRNIYHGDGTLGVKKGSIKKVRVVKIDYRRAPVGSLDGRNDEGGVHVANMVCTPIGLGQASWDTKEILGEADVEADGSVYFEIPARTPVYFQPIDEDGHVITTMRSWATMQPNEFYSCQGCHGDRDTPNKQAINLAHDRKPQQLKPFYNIEGGFSFRKHIQPILDKNCVSCHNDRSIPRIVTEDGKNKISVAELAPTQGGDWLKKETEYAKNPARAFSLLDYPMPNKRAKRIFNDAYYNLLQPQMDRGVPGYADFKNPLINWPGMQSVPTRLEPYHRGSSKSEIMQMLKSGHGKTKLSREELDKFAAWIDLYVPFCGDYLEAADWSDADKKFYEYYNNKGLQNEAAQEQAIRNYLKKIN